MGSLNITNVLSNIVAHKKIEVAQRKLLVPVAQLEKRALFNRATVSLSAALLRENGTGIIAEFKKQSPSKGIINDQADAATVTAAYEAHGAAGVSILSDEKFFGGSLSDVEASRPGLSCPILRKDFMIDAYQMFEAKAAGADVVLLIAACLSPLEVRQLAAEAKRLHLEVLLELHDPSELDHYCPDVDMVGINNRSLKTFEVNLDHSIALAAKLPLEKPRIAESGLNDPETVMALRQHGFNGFLMGERFMREPKPDLAFRDFMAQLNKGLGLL